jgi:hypothetical protein
MELTSSSAEKKENKWQEDWLESLCGGWGYKSSQEKRWRKMAIKIGRGPEKGSIIKAMEKCHQGLMEQNCWGPGH